jgi:type II secretory pathway component PulF
MADSEWSGAIINLVVAVMTLIIFKNVLIPQLKGLFAELKPAITGFISGLKKKKTEEKVEE